MRESAGVMEWWSSGGMQRLIQTYTWGLAFSNTPILPNSSTPRPLAIFTGKAIEI